MFKKFLCALLACIIIVNTTNYSLAIEEVNTQEQTSESELTISELFELRNSLVMNFEYFAEDIDLIDERLKSLGVEEISHEEVKAKLGLINDDSVQPCYNVSSTNNITWTSTRESYVYRGQSYELQVIRGVPSSGTSPLISSDLQSRGSTSSSFVATAKNVSKIIVNSVAGCLPEVGGAVVTLQTFYAIFKNVISNLSPTTNVGPVSCAYLSSISANYVYIFVKHSGAVDEGNQILAYCGNYLNYATQISIPDPVQINGTWFPNISSTTVNGTITSPYYNGYRDVASNVFWQYNNGNSNIPIYYDTYKFGIEALDDTIYLYAPTAFPS